MREISFDLKSLKANQGNKGKKILVTDKQARKSSTTEKASSKWQL